MSRQRPSRLARFSNLFFFFRPSEHKQDKKINESNLISSIIKNTKTHEAGTLTEKKKKNSLSLSKNSAFDLKKPKLNGDGNKAMSTQTSSDEPVVIIVPPLSDVRHADDDITDILERYKLIPSELLPNKSSNTPRVKQSENVMDNSLEKAAVHPPETPVNFNNEASNRRRRKSSLHASQMDEMNFHEAETMRRPDFHSYNELQLDLNNSGHEFHFNSPAVTLREITRTPLPSTRNEYREPQYGSFNYNNSNMNSEPVEYDYFSNRSKYPLIARAVGKSFGELNALTYRSPHNIAGNYDEVMMRNRVSFIKKANVTSHYASHNCNLCNRTSSRRESAYQMTTTTTTPRNRNVSELPAMSYNTNNNNYYNVKTENLSRTQSMHRLHYNEDLSSREAAHYGFVNAGIYNNASISKSTQDRIYVDENAAIKSCYCGDENYNAARDYCRICQKRKSPPYPPQQQGSYYQQQQVNKNLGEQFENEEENEEKIVFIPAILSSRGRPKSRLEEPIQNSKFERPNDPLYNPNLSFEANQQNASNSNQNLHQPRAKFEKSLYMYMGRPDGTVDVSRPVLLDKFNHVIQPIGLDNFEVMNSKLENSKITYSPTLPLNNFRNSQYNLPTTNQNSLLKEQIIMTQKVQDLSDDSDNYI